MTLTQKLRTNRAALVEAHRSNNTPADTVNALISSIGYDAAAEIIAAMVNAKGEWDGRLSRNSRAWAAAQNAPDCAALDAMCVWYCDEIHPAHMEQIAEAMQKAERPTETTENKEEPETMTATETKSAFPHIRAELERKHAERIENARYYIEYGFFPTWAEEHRTTPDRGLKEYSTPAKWDAYTAGKITREKAIECAVKRAEREAMKAHAAGLAKVESAENAADIISIEIDVTWTRSRTWGANPAAEITTRSENGYNRHTGTASGCGYDKLTAAVGSALNRSPEALKMLYTVQEKAFAEMDENARRAYKAQNESNRDTVHYGAGYGVLPYFEDGTGWCSFAGVFEKCGYTVAHSHSTKHSDYYFIAKKGGENA
jgi:hypothetical protein